MNLEDTQWREKGIWYNRTICKKLNGQIFEDYLKTGQKDRYEFLFYVDTYDIIHPSVTNNGSSSGGRPLTIISSTDAIESLGQSINFTYNFLQ